jgi:hypothetical protein
MPFSHSRPRPRAAPRRPRPFVNPPCAGPSISGQWPVISGQSKTMTTQHLPQPCSSPAHALQRFRPQCRATRSDPARHPCRNPSRTSSPVNEPAPFPGPPTNTPPRPANADPEWQCRSNRLLWMSRFQWSVVSGQWPVVAASGKPSASSTCTTTNAVLDKFAAAADPQSAPDLVEVDGIEPTTPCLQSRCSPS